MSIFIHGISLRNYRGIGSNGQKIGRFSECNFFIGANNSGKSCVLNFISRHLKSVSTTNSNSLEIQPLEVHLGAHTSEVTYGFATPSNVIENKLKELIIARNVNVSPVVFDLIKKLITGISEDGLIWTQTRSNNRADTELAKYPTTDSVRYLLEDNNWRILWNSITAMSGGSPLNDWIPHVIGRTITLCQQSFPPAVIIPAIRQIGKKGDSFSDLTGKGLIDRLAELQNPGPTHRYLTEKFIAINRFLQDVTGDDTAKIEIPHDRDEVLVHMNERVLPLSSLGTGIHEVVMIAAFCTLTEESIVCIEEPEIHLHPILQKKLIRYIQENTDNQYFIATHSASIIDSPKAAVFYVYQSNNETCIESATLPSQRFNACHDLGYKASDILQTNAIIWVEGPSDRIYLKNWIYGINPELQEGIHFSIMFYGGRLLSHLSSNDEDVSEFINLRTLNRNTVIVIDSDRESRSTRINDTKKRISKEFSENSEFAWITAGREIENYLAPKALETTLRNLYPSFHSSAGMEKYDHALHFKKKNGDLFKEVDKVKVAREMCKDILDLDVLDLRENILRIVNIIKSANHLH